jgi:hypothetical protein
VQSLEDLMASADLAMYENKRRKKNSNRLREENIELSKVAVA